MKKSLQLLLVAFLFGGIMLITSCKKDATISYNVADKELCLSPATFTGPAVVDSFIVQPADIEAAFSAAAITYSVNRISKVAAKGFKLKIKVNATASNLDYIGGAQVYIKTLGSTEDPKQIASINAAIAAGATEVEFSPSGLELKPYLGSAMVIYLHVFTKENFPGACVTLTKGVIEFTATK